MKDSLMVVRRASSRGDGTFSRAWRRVHVFYLGLNLMKVLVGEAPCVPPKK